MELDEAAWHLSSVINCDLGDMVTTYDNFFYDTLYYNISVQNGRVNLSDMNAVYTQAVSDITSTVNGLNLENKHIRFIGTDILDDGTVVMSILVSYGWMTHQWYFTDVMELLDSLSPYFDDYYYCNYHDFTDTLENVLNLLVAYHPNANEGKVSFLIANTVVFYFRNYIDPYDYNAHIANSRLFASYSSQYVFDQDEFFYDFDSYAGLAVDSCWCGMHHYNIIDFDILEATESDHGQTINYHQLTVRYGEVITPTPPTPPQD
jgi:hypothetical protein